MTSPFPTNSRWISILIYELFIFILFWSTLMPSIRNYACNAYTATKIKPSHLFLPTQNSYSKISLSDSVIWMTVWIQNIYWDQIQLILSIRWKYKTKYKQIVRNVFTISVVIISHIYIVAILSRCFSRWLTKGSRVLRDV